MAKQQLSAFETCLQLGKTFLSALQYECKNFIRVIELMEDGRFYICGTNAFAPECRYYNVSIQLRGNKMWPEKIVIFHALNCVH